MSTAEGIESFGVEDVKVKVKVEYETHENPNVQCGVTLNRLPYGIIKTEYQGSLEGINYVNPSLFPEHLDHSATIQRNVKEESDAFKEYNEDPLGLGDLEGDGSHCPTSIDLGMKSMKNDRDEKPHKCKSCDRLFTSLCDLKSHKLWHDVKRDQLHKCETCEKCFATPWMVKRHNVCHTGIKSFKCDVCGKGFASKHHVHTHRLTHHKCNVCEKSFTQPSDLKRHILYCCTKEKLDKSFMCDVCGKGFRTKYNLNAHRVSHSRLKPYKCNVCEKSYRRSSELKKHKVCQRKDNSYKCKLCWQTFDKSSDFNLHMKLQLCT